MRILAVSDVVVDRLYSAQLASQIQKVDLVIGCGDLPFEYLEFLVSTLNVPVLYVPGNHDPEYNTANPSARADGCENLDRRVLRVKGLSLAGLGGSVRYKPGRPANQYSQTGMDMRVASFLPVLAWQRFRSGRVLDLFIAHSPPRGIHDESDAAHVGFSAFIKLIRLVKPRYFLHGHTLVYKGNLLSPVTQMGSTTIINVYPYRMLEVEPDVQ